VTYSLQTNTTITIVFFSDLNQLCCCSVIINILIKLLQALSNCGVGIYISEKLTFCEVQFDSNCVENVWIKIALRGQDSLGCIYCIPSSNPYQSTSDLFDLLASLQGYSCNHMFLSVGTSIIPTSIGHHCHAPHLTHKCY